MLVILIAASHGEKANLLVKLQPDPDHAFQFPDTGGIEGYVPVPDSDRGISRTWEQLLTNNLHPVWIELTHQFLPTRFPGGRILILIYILVDLIDLIFVHAVFFHPSIIVFASFIRAASLSAVKVFISSSSVAGRSTSQSPA